jgi:hypothetical protein
MNVLAFLVRVYKDRFIEALFLYGLYSFTLFEQAIYLSEVGCVAMMAA